MPAKQKQVPFRTVEFRYTRIHVAVREAVRMIGAARARHLHIERQRLIESIRNSPPVSLNV